jgi:hypothetical protein
MDGLHGDKRLPCSVSWWSSVATTDFADPGFLDEQNVDFAMVSLSIVWVLRFEHWVFI